MDQKERCQSCAMPLGKGFNGSEADGTDSTEYCKFCYAQGAFNSLDMTVDDMIQLSIDNMTQELHYPEDKAKSLAQSIIPQLKRWRKEIYD